MHLHLHPNQWGIMLDGEVANEDVWLHTSKQCILWIIFDQEMCGIALNITWCNTKTVELEKTLLHVIYLTRQCFILQCKMVPLMYMQHMDFSVQMDICMECKQPINEAREVVKLCEMKQTIILHGLMRVDSSPEDHRLLPLTNMTPYWYTYVIIGIITLIPLSDANLWANSQCTRCQWETLL